MEQKGYFAKVDGSLEERAGKSVRPGVKRNSRREQERSGTPEGS